MEREVARPESKVSPRSGRSPGRNGAEEGRRLGCKEEVLLREPHAWALSLEALSWPRSGFHSCFSLEEASNLHAQTFISSSIKEK